MRLLRRLRSAAAVTTGHARPTSPVLVAARPEPPQLRTIICLANSVKLGDFCVAGVDPQTREWIRPLGTGHDGAVRKREQSLADGSFPRLLDLIELPLGDPRPSPGQPENWSLAAGRWKRVGAVDHDEALDLLRSLQTAEPLFGNRGKAVPESAVREGAVRSSLAIVCPPDLIWRKDEKGRISAVFTHAGRQLELKVTDPPWSRRFAGTPPGDHPSENPGTTFLTVSLGHEWNGFHWKLVAGVIELAR